MDGDFGLGQFTAFRSNELAVQRGKEHGVAAIALGRSTHCGAMAYYAIRAREHDLIGLAITNAGMNMTPIGGTAKIVGNNPFAMAVPTTRAWPMVLDIATSVVADVIVVLHRRGTVTPPSNLAHPAVSTKSLAAPARPEAVCSSIMA